MDLTEAVLNSWKTSHRVTVFLIRHIQPELWNKKIPGYPRKTIGMLAIHLHNTRYMWIKNIGNVEYCKTLTRVNPNKGTQKEVLTALSHSNEAMLNLLESCINNGGKLPDKPAWLNFPDDVIHFLSYFIAHEAHHRGQITMAARQLGLPLTRDLSGGLWQWNKRLKE